MIFAVLDPSPLTVCIKCSFLHLLWYKNNKMNVRLVNNNRVVVCSSFAILVSYTNSSVPLRISVNDTENVVYSVKVSFRRAQGTSLSSS